MAEKLPELIDCAGIQKEMRVKRSTAEAIMRQLPNVKVPGLRKLHVKRADVLALLEKNTSEATQAA